MDPFEREERRDEERGRLKKGRRDFRKHQEAVREITLMEASVYSMNLKLVLPWQVLDELVPKAGPGREARLEKKKMMAQKRRDREISPGTNVCVH